VEADVLELHAFAKVVDAQIIFRIRLTNHLITESQPIFVLITISVSEAGYILAG